MCQASQTLRCNNVATAGAPGDGSFISVLFTFSALKEPAKELKLSFMSGEKYVNKILLFSWSESPEVSLN